MLICLVYVGFSCSNSPQLGSSGAVLISRSNTQFKSGCWIGLGFWNIGIEKSNVCHLMST
jgi:hypothetical protein